MAMRQHGFTMIEMVIVIVVLGVIAAVAVPRYINMSGDAAQAAVAGMAGAAGSAMTLNYSGFALTKNVVTANKCVKVKTCSTATVSSLLRGGLPTGYSVSAMGTDIGSTNGRTAQCQVRKTSGTVTYKATFAGLAAGN